MTEVPRWDQLWSMAKEGQSLAYKNIQEVSKIHTDVTVLLIKNFFFSNELFYTIINIPSKVGKGYQEMSNESS